MAYELTMKPTFSNQLCAFPARDVLLIMEKVRQLQDDPTPQGKNKKRVVSYKEPVFRIRAGDYRILYTFGDAWVCILAVDRREDVYEHGGLIDTSGPGFDLSELPSAEDALAPRPAVPGFAHPVQIIVEPEQTPLERPVDRELLTKLRIDPRFHAALLRCRTFEALIEAPVPEKVRNRVFDVVATPNYEEVLQQPTFVVQDTDDLLRVHRGELIEFLLKLDPEQERHVSRAINAGGPVLVKGGPGTGKSTIAIYRVREVQRALQRQGVARPRILFTTYTNALIASTRQLLEQLLGEDACLVTVETADTLARRYVEEWDGPPDILDDGQLRAILMKVLRDAEASWDKVSLNVLARLRERLSLDYMVQEFEDVITARAVPSMAAYSELNRVGRQVPLQKQQRIVIWRLYTAYAERLRTERKTTWAGMRRRAAALVADEAVVDCYDAVFIDEVQDLQPNTLRMLVGICVSLDWLMLTADANQSIYGSGFSWAEVHADLRFQGRTGILRKNYRSTREIAEAAAAYLQDAGLEPEASTITHVASGPVPAVRFVPREAEAPLLVTYFRQATRDLRLGYSACAVLVPTESAGKSIERSLTQANVPARFMPGKALDLRSPCVKIITHRSAKGLEFPIVALAGFSNKLPSVTVGEEEVREREALERRALYVAMTRAMRALLVLAPGTGPSGLFTGFCEPLWNLGPVQ